MCTINVQYSKRGNAAFLNVGGNDALGSFDFAFEFNFDLIELRLVCSSPADYANDIEPS